MSEPQIPDGLTIVGLHIENVKKVTAMDIEPDGHVVTLTGKNGAGKSTVLDSIVYGLGGKSRLPAQPIRRGAKKASIKIDLEHFMVECRLTEGGRYLAVKTPGGATFPSPQAVLDRMVGVGLAFDPTEFLRLSRKEQARILLDLVGLDFTDLEERRAELYQKRAEVNRDLKRLQGAFDQAVEPRADTPDEEVSITELALEHQRILEHNQANGEQREAVDTLRADCRKCQRGIAESEDRARDLQEQLAFAKKELEARRKGLRAAQKAYDAKQAEVDALQDLDAAEVLGQMERAEGLNAAVRLKRERTALALEVTKATAAAEELTTQMAALDTEKTQALEKADFPVEGLRADHDGVTFGGVPFEQCSTAEQLRISLEIGWALNPKLRIMLVRSGNDLDDQSLAAVHQSAVDHDGQLWLERVRVDEGEAAIVIEEGAVVGPVSAEPS